MGSGGKFDYREVEKLQKQIEQLEREREVFTRECVRELATRLLEKVIKRTPTGRPPKLDNIKNIKVKGIGGKSKTFLSRNGAILQKYWSGYKGGTLKRGWTVGEIHKVGDRYEIEVINPVEYASHVEYGHRQQPGRYVPALGRCLKKGWAPGTFMMTISENQIKNIAPSLIKKRLEEKLQEVFDA